MTGLIVLQARLSSTRLAGKVLMPIYNGKSILDIQFDKLTSLGLPIVLATTINKVDDALSDWAKEKGKEAQADTKALSK